jgi:tetratricopeptide (TPR) repeat protein
LNQFDHSLKDLDDALEKDDNDPYHFFNRGNSFLAKRMFDEAQKDYDRAIAINKENPNFYFSKGLAFYDTKDVRLYDEAIKMFKKVISLCKTKF